MELAPLAHLQAFLAVARTRSFTGAARELGLSRSAVSQSISNLESRLGVVLVQRTTRSVALTDAGQRVVNGVGPALAQTAATLAEVSAKPGEVVGRLRLSVPQASVALVIEPLWPVFRAKHPRVDVEVEVDDRLVDIVAGGFDAGIRLSESIQRDMVQVRLTPPFRFVVVGAPKYLAKHGRPQKPEDLLQHECITTRSPTNGALYAWELERGKRSWRVPMRGGLVTNDGDLQQAMAKKGLGLIYAVEPAVRDDVDAGRLEVVLEAYAPSVPGHFLYYPSRARRSEALRLFVETATAVLAGR